MTVRQMDDILDAYKWNCGRLEFLIGEIDRLERIFSEEKDDYVGNAVSVTSKVTGMPGGGGSGDKVGRIACKIADEPLNRELQALWKEIVAKRAELERIARDVGIVRKCLDTLTEPERAVFRQRRFDDVPFEDIQYKGVTEKSARVIYRRVCYKIYKMVE